MEAEVQDVYFGSCIESWTKVTEWVIVVKLLTNGLSSSFLLRRGTNVAHGPLAMSL